jgi:hypothetical protein
MALTDTAVRKAKHREKPCKATDAQGLFCWLLVMA